MPFWIFAIVSTLGRMPGTWALSAGGAKAAAAQWAQLLALIAAVTAIALPLFYYRSRIVVWLRRRLDRKSARDGGITWPPIKPGEVVWSGENPIVSLREDAQGEELTNVTSSGTCTLRPASGTPPLCPAGASAGSSRDLPMERWLRLSA